MYKRQYVIYNQLMNTNMCFHVGVSSSTSSSLLSLLFFLFFCYLFFKWLFLTFCQICIKHLNWDTFIIATKLRSGIHELIFIKIYLTLHYLNILKYFKPLVFEWPITSWYVIIAIAIPQATFTMSYVSIV